MATKIIMKHKESGLVKIGFYGFSWTALLFGGWPAVFRRDWLMALSYLAGVVIASLFMGDIGLVGWQLAMGIVLGFVYNKQYTKRLLSQGFEFAGSPTENAHAAAVIGIGVTSEPMPA